jgi:acyl-coenzyme A thioesterase PaaI-like protein
VTATIAVRFRRPVAVGVPLETTGRVVADRGRLVDTAGELRRAGDGLLPAEATATFARVPAAQVRAWAERYLGRNPEESR